MTRRYCYLATVTVIVAAAAGTAIHTAVGQSASIAIGQSTSGNTRQSANKRTYSYVLNTTGAEKPLSLKVEFEESGEHQKLAKEDGKLESHTQSIIEQYRKAGVAGDSDERAELEEELHKTVEKHFDVRHRQRELEIAEVEARLRKLQEQLKKRKSARDEIVENRLDHLLREANGLGWGTGKSQHSVRRVFATGSSDPTSGYYKPKTGR